MKMKILIGVLVFLIVVNLATIGSFLYFRWHRPMEGPPPGDRLPPLLQQLTEEQREKLGEMIHQFREETREPSEQARSAEQELFALLVRNPVPKDSVYMTLEKLTQLRAGISKQAVDRLIETKQVLTAAQQELFMRAIMQPGRRDGGPSPGGPPSRMGRPPFGRGEFPGGPPPHDGPPDDGPPPEGPPDRHH